MQGRRSSRPLAVRRDVLLDVAAAAASAVLVSALLVPVLQLWRADLGVPFSYSWDSVFNLMLIKGVLHGSWYVNHQLGAPFGSELYDFAIGSENLDLALMRALGLVVHGAPAVMNVFFLLGFPLSALSAFAVLRWTGLTRLVATACSVLYALAPYPFARGERHLFLAVDFAVPLGCYLAIAAWRGDPLFDRQARGPGGLVGRRTALTVAACAVVASAGDGFYYAAFTMLLVAAGVALRAVATRSAAPLAAGVAVVALVAAGCAANLAPTFAYAAAHGRDYAVAERLPQEADVGGFKLAQLLEPVSGHRLAPLARYARLYDWSTQNVGGQERPQLGAIASVGFLWLLLVLVVGALRRGRRGGTLDRARPLAGATLVAFLLGSIGGLSSLIAYGVTPQLRAWNRISIFIAFLAVVAVGLLLDRLRGRLSGSAGRRAGFALGLAALVGLGVLDQTSPADVPLYRQLAAKYRADGRFVARIESRLPRGAMVFELPYMPYPEGMPPGRLWDYDTGRPYLHSTDLRWSYGAMKQRPEDWSQQIVEKPVPEVVGGVAAAGFDGIYVDRGGYRPASADALEASLVRLLGVRPLVGGLHRSLLFFDVRPYAARLRSRLDARQLAALRTATLAPPRLVPGTGMDPAEEVGTLHSSWWFTSRRAVFDIYEPGPPELVKFFGTFRDTSPRHRAWIPKVVLRWPDRETTVLPAGARGSQFSLRVRLRHGDNLVELTTDATRVFAPWDARKLFLELVDARFSERAFDLVAAPGHSPRGDRGVHP